MREGFEIDGEILTVFERFGVVGRLMSTIHFHLAQTPTDANESSLPDNAVA
jgi:hypothetical protein